MGLEVGEGGRGDGGEEIVAKALDLALGLGFGP